MIGGFFEKNIFFILILSRVLVTISSSTQEFKDEVHRKIYEISDITSEMGTLFLRMSIIYHYFDNNTIVEIKIFFSDNMIEYVKNNDAKDELVTSKFFRFALPHNEEEVYFLISDDVTFNFDVYTDTILVRIDDMKGIFLETDSRL